MLAGQDGNDVPGFLANHALFREALSIIENDIADPKDVDDAIRYGFGMRCPRFK